MKLLNKILIAVTVLIIIYFFGPTPDTPKFSENIPNVPEKKEALQQYITAREKSRKIKPDNEARIVWYNDSLQNPTEYVLVYLHGFSASQKEGDPVHRNIAKTFGCNLYLSRMAEHGIDTTEQLITLTADKYWESAKRALFIGKRLGKKVILMGTSTGGSLALQLAAAYPKDVHALILYSPNIAINDPNAWILNNHWGLQIARLVKGGKYHNPADERPIYKAYWNKPYRLEAAVELQQLLELSMTQKTFTKVKQPTLLLYYYKDEQNQDNVVRVDAMLKMFNNIGTAANLKVAKAIANAGDHVICSPIKSNAVQEVEQETNQFLQQICNLKPVDTTSSIK